jgi:hypothetical protein
MLQAKEIMQLIKSFLGCSTMPNTQRNAKVLIFTVKKVKSRNIRKNTEIIRLYSQDINIGGCVSAYVTKRTIWVDSCPSISPNQRYRWTTIRLYAKLDDIGGLLSV